MRALKLILFLVGFLLLIPHVSALAGNYNEIPNPGHGIAEFVDSNNLDSDCANRVLIWRKATPTIPAHWGCIDPSPWTKSGNNLLYIGTVTIGNSVPQPSSLYAESTSSYGVYGKTTSPGYGGVGGSGATIGVKGYSSAGSGIFGYSTSGHGVYGETNAASQSAVKGVNNATGTSGTIGGNSYGAYGIKGDNYGYLGGDYGAYGNNGAGTWGYLGGSYGVYGTTVGSFAVRGEAIGSGTGIYGSSASGYAGYFNGNVYTSGSLSVQGNTIINNHFYLKSSTSVSSGACTTIGEIIYSTAGSGNILFCNDNHQWVGLS